MGNAAAAAAAAAALGGCALMPDSVLPPQHPASVAVPPGHREAMTLSAAGSINYECRLRAGMAGAYHWVMNAHDATLRHWSGLPAGRLYEGPTWQHRDGSRVSGRLLASAANQPGRLREQLWQAERREGKSAGKGAFSQVSYVRRRNAEGGGEPDAPCDAARVGQGSKAAYRAEYVFYEKAAPLLGAD